MPALARSIAEAALVRLSVSSWNFVGRLKIFIFSSPKLEMHLPAEGNMQSTGQSRP
jgi:hypothetical protein